jgi:septal ring factor EnvC (AmiA/AmiB activator)
VSKQLKIGFAAGLSVAALAGFGAIAGAEPSDTEQNLASARNEAELITSRINSQSAEIAELEQQARDAAAREADLRAQLRESTARSTALNDDLLAAEDEREAVRARYKRALGVLSDRLVEIYKGSEPDLLSVVLESEGFEEMETRAEYLEALTEADERIADRVSDLHDEVSGAYEQIAGLKSEIDAEARRLEAAHREIEAARAEAQRRAAEIARARESEQTALSELQEKISGWELEVRREAAEQLGDSAFLGGPYAIPTYIVMCESGGNYRAYNPSSGAGGAYQIIPSTWRAHGGRGYAHQASKAEQDRIARLIWENDGPGAWSCA